MDIITHHLLRRLLPSQRCEQLQAEVRNILPLLMAIDRSNFERMKFWATIAEDYIQKGKTVGFFGVAMKKGSDNLRDPQP